LKKILLSFLAIACSGVAVYASVLLPMFPMPEPTGSFAVGTVARHLTDSSRDETLSDDSEDKRELMINIWYPVDQDQAAVEVKEHYPSDLGAVISLVFGIPKLLFSHVTEIPTHIVEGAVMSSKEARYQVLVFSPGIRSTRFQSMTTIEDLVSQGYIMVGLDHPFTSAQVKIPDSRIHSYVPEPKFEISSELYGHNVNGVGIRAADASFVLDNLTN
jgi:predicted dienelactone hydrolase